MKKATWAAIVATALFGGLACESNSWAEDAKPVDCVIKAEGKMWAVRGGQTVELENNVQWPHDILVKTNGTFTVKNGRPRELKESQTLRADGMLLGADGSIVPVYDHVIMKAGRPSIMRDGTLSALQRPVSLDGNTIQPDGYVLQSDGRRLRLLDGQMFALDGSRIPATDTITLTKGTVMVQKDGSQFKVPQGRSLMMNDGTKVFGDGTVILNDGTKTQLAEGEVITVQGVVTRR